MFIKLTRKIFSFSHYQKVEIILESNTQEKPNITDRQESYKMITGIL